MQNFKQNYSFIEFTMFFFDSESGILIPPYLGG
jgi:hypothetical protein